MIEVLYENPDIANFLDFYPKPYWKECIEAACVYGIKRIHKRFKSNLNYETLIKISGIKTIKKSSKNPVFEDRYETNPQIGTDKILANRHRELKYSSEYFETSEDLEFFQSPTHEMAASHSAKGLSNNRNSKLFHHRPPPVKLSDFDYKKSNKVPRYLQQVKSKIKNEVRKDVALYNYKSELKGSHTERQKPIENKNKKPELQETSKHIRNDSTLSLSFTQEVKEPNTCSLEQLQKYSKYMARGKSEQRKNTFEESSTLKIADDFLRNPLTAYLVNSSPTVPTSPQKPHSFSHPFLSP
ncbi:unnamed protein product [Blepharisma stoltei]|uniref:Uncharacterized protein n=1 Tax=Blepharisma stoltei TaxID=1481888 RepID=A0AAU9J8P8_9CILI|nr:unnamed protein product [Blepharisma stoltei]